jgi:hypothetical protein
LAYRPANGLNFENVNMKKQIVPGISVDSSGQAMIDPSVKDILLDLALNLEGPTGLPVDIEHVVAAIVLAARADQIEPNAKISAEDTNLIDILAPHVRSIFATYGGKVGDEH